VCLVLLHTFPPLSSLFLLSSSSAVYFPSSYLLLLPTYLTFSSSSLSSFSILLIRLFLLHWGLLLLHIQTKTTGVLVKHLLQNSVLQTYSSITFFYIVVITLDKIETRPTVSLFYPSKIIIKSNSVDSFFISYALFTQDIVCSPLCHTLRLPSWVAV